MVTAAAPKDPGQGGDTSERHGRGSRPHTCSFQALGLLTLVSPCETWEKTFPGLFTTGKTTLHPGQLDALAHLMLPSLLGALGTQPPARRSPSHRICLSVSS